MSTIKMTQRIKYVKRPLMLCLIVLVAFSMPFILKAQPIGANMANPLIMGNYGQGSFTYTDTKSNATGAGYLNDFGQASDDIYYKFIVQGNTEITVSHCGSGFDTYVWIIKNTGEIVASKDDNGPSCSGTEASVSASLTPGTYYIISEGYSTLTGSIKTSATLTVQAPPTPPDTRNFIRLWDATSPQTNPNTLMAGEIKDVKQSTQYFDGLGRPEQTVIKKGSLSNGVYGDLVSLVEYDEFGREAKKYLPYVAATVDGLYKTTPLTEQNSFYMGATSPISGQGETFFYGKTDFEASPLNRPLKTYTPGNSWVGSSVGTSAKYWINTDLDAVRIWNVTPGAIGSFSTYNSPGAYPAGQLYKNVSVDENSKQVIEFKDKEGKIILKKVQLTATADYGNGTGYLSWLSTYYLYDDLGNLRCVIQPEGVKAIQPSWVLDNTTATVLAEQCFRYEYDKRNRLIVKKVPGAGEVYMVYDSRDRVVMTQDANMRINNKWMVTKYDALNRSIETGLLVSSIAFSVLAEQAYSVIDYPATTTGYEQLTVTYYDNYNTLPSVGLSSTYLPIWNSSFAGTDLVNSPYPQLPTQSTAVKGMITWTKVKVLDSSPEQFIYSIIIYDDKGRVIQSQSKNDVTGGVDVVTTQYSWDGKVLAVVQKQEITGTNAQVHTLVTKMDYDELGRVKEVKKKIDTDAEKSIAKQGYDKLGQLLTKNLAPGYNGNANGIETLSYEYNIRGWLLGVNRSYLNSDNSTKFGFELAYDKKKSAFDNNVADTYIAAQLNGNITGMMWRSMGDGEKRKYDFEYDEVNRLTKADFKQYTSGWNNSAGIDFSVGGSAANNNKITYDDNGNIKGMWQKGLKLNTSDWIDQMSYTYYSGTNKLQAVTDAITTENKLGDFFDKNNGASDYGYDKNGNMVTDRNKDLGTTTGLDLTIGGALTYNHLNLPQTINVTGKGTITYTYDAAGNKIKKVTNETASGTNNNTNTVTTVLYTGASVFESKVINGVASYTNKLQFTGQEEGRIRPLYAGTTSSTITGYAYDYMLKDHLGNVRMVLTDEIATNYYPAATLEGTYDGTTNSMVNNEKTFYRIDNTKIVTETGIASWPTETVANTKLYYNNNSSPSSNVTPVTPPNLSYPAGCTPTQTDGSSKLYKLNATSNKTGLEFMIKVMAGDKIDIFGKSYFLNTGTVNNANSTTLDLLGLMTNMLLAPANAATGKGFTAGALNTMNNGLVPSSFFRGSNGETTTIPKAYINYIFFDEQFKYAGGGASRVGTSGIIKEHWYVDGAQLSNISVPKNGYIFVYVSNESNLDVFFDNLQVVHKPGSIVEETHYYPFGLTMAGISSKAVGKLENKFKFNDGSELQAKEFSDGGGLELYSTDFRSYDPQIGRFHQIDALADYAEYNSPYVFASNNPISFNDPTGLKDSTRETSTVHKPKRLDPVIVIAKVKIKQKKDNTINVIKINLHLQPLLKPKGQGGIYQRGEGGGGSTATPSDEGDKDPVDLNLLMANNMMYIKLRPFELPNVRDPFEWYERAHDVIDLYQAQKKAEEEKKSEDAKTKPANLKKGLAACFLRKGAIVYDRQTGTKMKMLGNGVSEPSSAQATDTFPAQKIPGYYNYPK